VRAVLYVISVAHWLALPAGICQQGIINTLIFKAGYY